MKLICTQENFKKAIYSSERVVSKQSTLPILNNILFEAEKGPFKYLSSGNWKPNSVRLIVKNPKLYLKQPFVKFTGAERTYLEDHPKVRDKIFSI